MCMRVMTRLIFLNEENEKFFGEGPYRLLKKVEETGSLHASAIAMGMAYSKATKLLKNAEKSLGVPLTVRKIGGKSGGGSLLTEEACDFMHRYERYRDACVEHNKKMFEFYFGNVKKYENQLGCVIMASGMGKRYGKDKLMEELQEKPMIQYVVEATEDLFAHRVVVTRNDRVRVWCEERKIPVVFHDMPGRNDTIRLGIEALEEQFGAAEFAGCVFCPADMPLIRRDTLQLMCGTAGERENFISRVAYQGKAGAPVLFSKDYFEELKQLPDKAGGREVMRAHQDRVFSVEAKDEYELWDVDTPEDLESVKQVLPLWRSQNQD